MKYVTVYLTRIEVACTRHGKPSYRWANGYHVTNREGNKLYPAVLRNEMHSLVREMYGDKAKLKIT